MMIVNNEVTLSRKNCKINTSQLLFRGLVVDHVLESSWKKYKESEHNEVGMKSEIDPSQEYEITEITKSEYEDEIVMAVNIN